jgi:AsmA protein
MARPLKIVLVVLGALLALAVVAAAIVAATFDPNAYKPQIVELVQRQHQRTLSIPGRIELSFFPRLGAALGQVQLSEHRSKTPFASVESARVSVALWPLLRREVVVDRIQVTGLRADLKRHKDGRTNVDDLTQPSKATPAPAPADGTTATKLDIGGIDVRDSVLTFDDRKEGRRIELAVATLRTGRIAPGAKGELALDAQVKASAPALSARLRLDGGYLVDSAAGRYAFDKLQARVDGTLDKAPLELRLDVPQLEVGDQVKGQKIEARLKQTQGARSIDLRVALPAFTGTREALRTTLTLALDGKQGDRAFQVAGDGHVTMNLDKGNGTLDLKGKVDDSSYTARLWVAQFAPLSMRFDVAVDALDADRYRSTLPVDPKAPPPPEAPIDLSGLRQLDLRGTLKVGSLKMVGLKATDVRADLKAAGGRLDVSPISARLYQGSASGSATLVAASPPRVAMRQTLADVQLGPLLQDLTGKAPVEGRGRLVLDVASQGALPSALKKSLSGTARVELRDGAVRGFDLGRIVSIAGGKGTGSGADKTEFSQLDASFRIDGGVARNDDLLAVSPLLRVTGAGAVDIGDERLDYLVKAQVTGPIPRLQGKTVPVRLQGPFTSVGYSVDVGSLAKEALQDRIEKSLGDKLKGLFGR